MSANLNYNSFYNPYQPPGKIFPPPWWQGKNVDQGGCGQFNFDKGSWLNDNFNQGGWFNRNFGFGGFGNDNFDMGGLFNINYASGGAGNDNFEVGGGLFNKNYADGGQGKDTFVVNNDGICNETFINGGEGQDTVKLDGSRWDYESYEDEKGIHYRHKESGNIVHLQNVENIQFSKPDIIIPPNWQPSPDFMPYIGDIAITNT
ncbi:MAG: hypothetical protein AB1782_04975 [Cyanobacteriota bacterium]